MGKICIDSIAGVRLGGRGVYGAVFVTHIAGFPHARHVGLHTEAGLHDELWPKRPHLDIPTARPIAVTVASSRVSIIAPTV